MNEDNQDSENLIDQTQKKSIFSTPEITKIVLQWNNLSYRIKNQNIDLHVLKEVSGFSNPGEILAIIGASGSGKTSLLNLLSNRVEVKNEDEISGSISANSQSILDIQSNHYLKFITQENILIEYLTPFEYLLFVLRLKSRVSDTDARERVEEVLSSLKLTDIKNTIIGGLIYRGISGGEKKRLCIASELLFYPSVLVLDEPTSGLDSFMAKNLISILSEIKKFGINIILTVHQPGNEIFQMFDRLIIMQEGRFVYQGQAKCSLGYFKESGFDIPKFLNPPEVYMRILKINDRKNISKEEEGVIGKFKKMYEENDERNWHDLKKKYLHSFVEFKIDEKVNIFLKAKWLFLREAYNYKRNYYLYVFKILYVVGCVYVLDISYYNLGYDIQGIENRKGLIIAFLITVNFASAIGCTMAIAFERKITVKEINDSLYSITAYLLVKIIIEIFFMLVTVTLYTFLIYYITNLNTESDYKVIIFCLIGMVSYLVGSSAGIFAGTISDSYFVANAFGTAIASAQMVFSGFFSDPDCSPELFQWIKYLTPMYFLRNAIMKNEFDDLDIDEDVYLKPKDLYGYKGDITKNILVNLIHVMIYIILSYLMYSYSINKSKVKK